MCEQIDADLIPLRERAEAAGSVRDFLIRRRVGELDFLEVRVAVVGNVDAGKSTLLGVLTHGELDNGRGFMESGRTSSVGNDILGFDQEGEDSLFHKQIFDFLRCSWSKLNNRT
uniref:Uncharacterized protein n=1 Tax=Neogobius melanostomus TaxID=47308 RepID=A0A8C6V023_9GOBI